MSSLKRTLIVVVDIRRHLVLPDWPTVLNSTAATPVVARQPDTDHRQRLMVLATSSMTLAVTIAQPPIQTRRLTGGRRQRQALDPVITGQAAATAAKVGMVVLAAAVR